MTCFKELKWQGTFLTCILDFWKLLPKEWMTFSIASTIKVWPKSQEASISLLTGNLTSYECFLPLTLEWVTLMLDDNPLVDMPLLQEWVLTWRSLQIPYSQASDPRFHPPLDLACISCLWLHTHLDTHGMKLWPQRQTLAGWSSEHTLGEKDMKYLLTTGQSYQNTGWNLFEGSATCQVESIFSQPPQIS